MDNNNKMKEVLTESASMSENSVDLILKAIDDMQNKINLEVEEKLHVYVFKTDLDDLESELKTVSRRVAHNEGNLKNCIATGDKNAEMIESSRKKMTRMQGDIDNLRKNTSSALSLHDSPATKFEESFTPVVEPIASGAND